MNSHEQLVQLLFNKVCAILKADGLTLRIIKRKGKITKGRYLKGYINLRKRIIGLDIYTPKKMEPKSFNGLIRTICHEVAHLQKLPYKQYYKRHWIIRQHYPAFYKQIERNINKIKKDATLGAHFEQDAKKRPLHQRDSLPRGKAGEAS
ncbi:MAG: hypothetical protein V1928_01700 [Parcubacteria group bacterium]